jgi:hypothetical protein
VARQPPLSRPARAAPQVHTWRTFRAPREREVVLHCRHKGFCRLAIEQGAHLVPVLALGETLQLRNLLDLPALQQYTYRRRARRTAAQHACLCSPLLPACPA